jgi:hypothetical protein
MANYITVLFKGNNGLGTIDLAFNPGIAGAKVLMVRQIFSSISGSTVSIVDRTGQFSSEMYLTTIEQTAGNDWSDCLLLAVIQLL